MESAGFLNMLDPKFQRGCVPSQFVGSQLNETNVRGNVPHRESVPFKRCAGYRAQGKFTQAAQVNANDKCLRINRKSTKVDVGLDH